MKALYKQVLLAFSVLSNLCIIMLKIQKLMDLSQVYLEQQRVMEMCALEQKFGRGVVC